MAKLKARQHDLLLDPMRGPIFTVRFAVSVLLMVLGIAWIVFYYVSVRHVGAVGLVDSKGSPHVIAELKRWNYLIGFGALFLGLAISAHPSTPLGRGRGVVTGMLGCFLIGLVWICTFYIVSDKLDPTSHIAVFNDLQQKNLLVGIGFMAVGFTFATRWE